MNGEGRGSVSCWLAGLKAGDREAIGPLWERYFHRLVRLARGRLRAYPRAGHAADEQDAALSAFHSFCAGAARGQFPQLECRDDLWRLLMVITSRKVTELVRRERSRKRGDGRVFSEADLAADGQPPLDRVVGPEPSPEFAAAVVEEYRRLLDVLGDETLCRVAVWKMEGLTRDEIAGRLGCARRTVARQLDLIRKIWTGDPG